MDLYTGLIVVVSLVHIFAAVIWIGGNFFELMTLVPALRKNSKAVQDEIATTVPLQEHKNSAVSATVTVVAGPILAYLYSNGNMSVFVTTTWGLLILFGGTLALVLYVVGWYAGSLRVKIATFTKSAILAGAGGTTSELTGRITPLSNQLSKMIYLENALGALVLLSMILAATI